MTADYDSIHTVRLSRRWGWGLASLILVGVLVSWGWAVAEVSERRAMQATRENLQTSLTQLSAERVAKDGRLDQLLVRQNPFGLLRWTQDNYCGELDEELSLESGCWYWLASRFWVVYQSRFTGRGWGRESRRYAWRLLAVPRQDSAAMQSGRAVFALELEPVTDAELATTKLLRN